MLLGYAPLKINKARMKEMFKDRRKHREEIIRMNLGLLRSCAVKCYRPGISQEDLISEGFFGLLHAIENFDGRGEFATYAVPCIMGYIRKAICHRWQAIRMPDYKYFKKGAKSIKVASLSQPVGDTDKTIGDFIVDKKDQKLSIDVLIHGWKLKNIDKEIIKNAVAGMSLRKNGWSVNLCGERVRQKLKEIGKKYRDEIK